MSGAKLAQMNDENLAGLLEAERAVLVLAKSSCASCAGYQKQIESLLTEGTLRNVSVGKLILDQPGSVRFKRQNPWLTEVKELPFTVLFYRGKVVDSFAASKGTYLLERLEQTLKLAS